MTDVYSHPDYQQFIARIRERPDDDVVRLVFADWLEERGHGERAEFIRISIAATRHPGERLNPDATYGEYWTLKNRAAVLLAAYGEKWFTAGTDFYSSLRAIFKPNDPHVVASRGFVSRVSGPLASLHGGECSCGATEQASQRYTIPRYSRHCSACRGTGRTPGILAELLRREPVGCDGIEVRDRSPLETAVGSFVWNWTRMVNFDAPYIIPYEVFNAIEPRPNRGEFPTADSARLVLSRALYSIHAPKSEVLT